MNRTLVKSLTVILGIAACICSLTTTVVASDSRESNPGISPIHSPLFGKSYGEWSVKWWQWALAIPTPSNPMLDTTGAFCDVDQHGPVWFLTGVFGGSTAERTCTVPGGKHILFPIANYIWINSALDNPADTETDYRQYANKGLHPSIGGDLEATLDGKPIVFNPGTPITRSQSPVFTATFPADNIFGIDPSLLTGYPIVSDGFWVMLPPLEPGEHNLHFRAGQPLLPDQDGTYQNVTYHLTVGKSEK